MRLYLIRHGDAVDESIDARRPLSDRGRQEAASLAARMRAEGGTVRRIFHSGKTRAEETASILAAALQPTNGVSAVAGLKPNDPPKPIAAAIAGWTEDTMLVGHLPFLRNLARLLLPPECPPPEFPTGGAAAFEPDPSGLWRITARFGQRL